MCKQDEEAKRSQLSLEKSPKTTVQSRVVRDGNRASGVPVTFTPIVAAHRIVGTTKPSRWSPTLNKMLLIEGSEPRYKRKILQDGRSSKWELDERQLIGLPGRK